ncbi:shikimate kinase 3, chloroplastic [Rosa chinensis]|uniref:shikimate kinase 3, chloroplastic n=1 Tax=Rosa chinensis TaxID=74649 RepID=UPI000D096A18|nr:shikimate kinase 3, chloroplastic [Rosa chinensis]
MTVSFPFPLVSHRTTKFSPTFAIVAHKNFGSFFSIPFSSFRIRFFCTKPSDLPQIIIAIQHPMHHTSPPSPPHVHPLLHPLPNPASNITFVGSSVESGNFYAHFDESLVLKSKSQDIEPYLNGRCIYFVGMMGSGKTTVGNILSQALNYSFIDSDTFVEHEAGGKSVAEIFKLYGEGFFRDKETEALRKLSMMQRHVVSTGGGAVVRPVNWKCMQKGISVWLDVPLEALAQRIADVGTGSRPLLHQGPGDAYSKTFMRLSSLFKERGDAYANANARVSLQNIAAKMGYRDVSNLSPTSIALEALQQIECFLEEERGRACVF